MNALQKAYPEADMRTARTTLRTLEFLATGIPTLIVMDLSIPEKVGGPSLTDNGIDLLRSLMQQYPILNFVGSEWPCKALYASSPTLMPTRGGFTIVDKSLPLQEMLTAK